MAISNTRRITYWSRTSPLVQALVKKALKAGKRPAVLLRGYGAAAGPRPLAVSASTLAVASGDEAREHALAGPWAVWVDADRRRSGQAAVAAGAQVLVLDDGFQRRHQVARDLDLLLADWAQIQAGEQLLPAGPWRKGNKIAGSFQIGRSCCQKVVCGGAVNPSLSPGSIRNRRGLCSAE